MSINFLSHQDGDEQKADAQRRRDFIQRMERKLEVKEATQQHSHSKHLSQVNYL
jgi:hypothetical protein